MTEIKESHSVKPPLKLLIVGGYGTFGGRLADLLKDEIRLQIIVAGRHLARATEFCSLRRDANARLVPAGFDRNADVPGQLKTLAPDVLVDASGPFQAYGEKRYSLIQACIALGVQYLDLADGSAFVAGVSDFDAAAREAGVYVLSGVSSFPVLTAAVVRHLSRGMTRIASIRGGIAPSPYAGVGGNVVRAIAQYAGQPVALTRGALPTTGYPFTDNLRYTIAPPGRVPLKNTLFSLVDVPDLRALAERWPGAEEIWMGAGPLPEILHRALISLAWLVRWRLLHSLSPLARLMFFVTNHLRWGEHRGGMFVVVAGVQAAGEAAQYSWHLLAEGDDGPLIPSMAVEAIVRQVLEGQHPAPGARAAINELELADYETLFKNRTIYTGTRDDATVNRQPLFARLLGDAWQRLPPKVAEMHMVSAANSAEGRCVVDRGSGMASNWAATLFGFPKASEDLPVSVRFTCAQGVERWTRRFGEQIFASTLQAGHGGHRAPALRTDRPVRFRAGAGGRG